MHIHNLLLIIDKKFQLHSVENSFYIFFGEIKYTKQHKNF